MTDYLYLRNQAMEKERQRQQRQQYESAYSCATSPTDLASPVDYSSYPYGSAGEHSAVSSSSPYCCSFSSYSPVPSPAPSQQSVMTFSPGSRSSHYNLPKPLWFLSPSNRTQRRFIQPEVYARRRATANLRERGRMSEMNRAFDRLRGRIPIYPPSHKLSKIDTLRLARQYIYDLRKLLSDDLPMGCDCSLNIRITKDESSDEDSTSPRSSSSGDGLDSNLSSSNASDEAFQTIDQVVRTLVPVIAAELHYQHPSQEPQRTVEQAA